MKTIIEKWIARIYCDDLYIGPVRLKETSKQYRYEGYEPGEGKNTIFGFDGNPVSVRTLLGYRTVIDKSCPWLHDSYEEAYEALKAAVAFNLETAERRVDTARSLQLLFNEVEYIKQ